jgi:transposase
MKRTVVLQEVRTMRFEEINGRFGSGRLTTMAAAELLGVSERTFHRWRGRYEERGADGLQDRRLGKPSPRRVPAEDVERVLALYHGSYAGFTVKHFHEYLIERHGIRLSYSWTKTALQAAGLVKRAPRRGAHRKKRPRRPLPGMLLHQDASRHAWLPDDEALYDLVVTMDDATGAIYSAFLVAEEGTRSSLCGLRETIDRHGLFCALYTDRGSHYFLTPESGGRVAKISTQVGRALAQLGIQHIPAYSPQARGRSERAFGTLQDRLPKEFALAGVADVDAANRFLAETYIPRHNARFAVPAAEPGTAFVPDPGGLAREALCIQEERRVGNDNTVRYRGLVLQLPPSPLRHHFVRTRVRVHDYPDGTLAVFHGPHRLADYDAQGCLLTPDAPPKSAGQAKRSGGPRPARSVEKGGQTMCYQDRTT